MTLQYIELDKRKLSEMSRKFWTILSLKWFFSIFAITSVIGFSISLVATIVIIYSKGQLLFSEEALWSYATIFLFHLKIWSLLGFSISFLFSFKSIFEFDIDGYRFTLSKLCSNKREKIERVSIDDIRPIWRVWLLKSVVWSLILSLLSEIVREWLQIERDIYSFYLIIFIILFVGWVNLLYILRFHRDISICRNIKN